MLTIHERLDLRSVEASLAASTKRDALAEMLSVLARSIPLPDRDALLAGLLERERSASTGVGGGVAFPHKLLPEFPATALALGRSTRGIPFDAADGRPVVVVFLLLGPAGQHAQHLMVLSRLARLFRQGGLTDEILRASDAAGMLAALRSAEAT
jgi:mannitol/fructose-specific phosphotransferase system IIA component (Ntr-type)